MSFDNDRYVDVCRERLQKAVMVWLYLVYVRSIIFRTRVINNLCGAVAGPCCGTNAASLLPGFAHLDRDGFPVALQVIVQALETCRFSGLGLATIV